MLGESSKRISYIACPHSLFLQAARIGDDEGLDIFLYSMHLVMALHE